ncbi:Rid family hydrolase [Actinomycetes bacterium KLBMP 9797]
MMFLEPVSTAGAPQPFGHYAQATVTPDGAIWVSTQLPVGVSADSSVAEQTRQALTNVLSIVEAGGGRAGSVARLNLYLTDISDWASVDAVVAAAFGDHRPARAVLQVAGLHHGFRVAADAVAWRIHGR